VSKLEIPANSRATAYLNLVDTKVHAAWVYSKVAAGLFQVYTFYMTEAFERVVMPLLELPDGPQPLQYLVRYSHQAARKAELERRSLSDIRPDVLLAEAVEGYAALSTLLGDSMYFFNERYLISLAFLTNVGARGYLILRCLRTPGRSLID
jgi:hypothetical protein